MFLSSRRYFAGLIFSLFFLVSAHSQTLYWVGGSGNFNDPNHWSFAPEGAPANIVPNANSEVVFENSGFNGRTVNVSGLFSIKSLKIKTYENVSLVQSGAGKIEISTSFEDILDNQNFSCDVPLKFISSSSKEGTISSGHNLLSSSIEIAGGKWHINKLKTTKKLEITNSEIRVLYANVKASDLIIKNCSKLELVRSHLQIPGSIAINGNTNYYSDGSFLNKDRFSTTYQNINFVSTLVTGKFGNNNQTNALCMANPIPVKATCIPGCDGKIIFSVPSFSCFTANLSITPAFYKVLITGGCGTLAVSSFTSGQSTTYTLTSICNCGVDYAIELYDENDVFLDVAYAPMTAPTIGNSPQSQQTTTINCFGNCTGSMSVTFFGGTAPYSFSVIAQSGGTTTSSSNGNVQRTGLCAGQYSIAVVDAAGCTQPTLYVRNFEQPTYSISASPLSRNVACFGDCTGGYTITPSGGNGPTYTVSFSNGPSFTPAASVAVNAGAVCSGTLAATILDSKNCPLVTTVTIAQPPSAMTVAPTSSNITCGGACSGYAEVLVTGSTGNFTYSWSANSATTYSNGTLCANNTGTNPPVHTVTVTETNFGCVRTQTFFIDETDPLAITGNVTNVVCNGSLTGAISATIAGGTQPFNVTWVRSAGSATVSSGSTGSVTTASGLAADTYTMFVVDNASCTIQQTFALTQPPTAVSLATSAVNNATCIGSSSGSATLTASGGNGGPFSYSWIGGTVNIASGLPAGNYTATVRDASNCPSPTTINVVVSQPTVFIPGETLTHINCFNQCTGVIATTPSIGNAPYTFTLAGPTATSPLSTASGSAAIFSNLCAGLYTLSIMDNTPGTCAQLFQYALNQPTSAVNAVPNFTAATCSGSCTGVLTGSANGGTSGYTYTWTSSSTVTAAHTLTGQCSSIYTLSVTDNLGCVDSETVNLTEPTPVSISGATTAVSCLGGTNTALTSDGTIDLTVSGGDPFYSYNWNGPGIVNLTTQDLNNLVAGVYTVIVTSSTASNNCVQIPQTFTVGAPSTSLSLSTNGGTVSCFNLCDATATITPAGGTPTYSFQFVTSSNTFTNTNGFFNNVCGQYTAVVIDSKGCTARNTGSVDAPQPIAPNSTVTNVACFGICTGSIVSAASGGVGSTYTYVLSGPAPSAATQTVVGATSSFFNLCNGNYTLFIQDASGTCPQPFPVSINQPAAALSASIIPTPPSCNGLCDGILVANPVGGTAPYSYTWIVTGSPTTSSIINQCATTNPANPYTLTVRDASNCITQATVNLTQPTAVSVSVNTVNVNCSNSTNANLTATVTGGPTGNYGYTWQGGLSTSSVLANVGQGTYSVQVTDNGCIGTGTGAVTAPNPITSSVSSFPTKCNGSPDGTFQVTYTGGGTGAVTFSLLGASAPTNTTGLFGGLSSGTYSALITDANGCTVVSSSTLVAAPPTVTASITGNLSSCSSCNGASTVTAGGGTGQLAYVWSNSLSTIPGATNTTVGSLCPGPHTVIVSDQNNCTSQATVQIDPIVIVVAVPGNSINCFGDNNGTATIQVTGTGAGPYQYSWTPSGLTTQAVSTLSAGVVYVATATDTNNCVGSNTVQILGPLDIGFQLNSLTPVSCSYLNDGAIAITPTGGPSSGTYGFTWTPGGSNSQNQINLTAGDYLLKMSKGSCTRTEQFTITVGPANASVTPNFTLTNPSDCIGASNGSICLNPTGGNGANTYTYTWSGSTNTTNCLSGLPAAVYNTTVASGACTFAFSNTLTPPVTPTITLVSSASVACNSFSTGSASFTTTGPTGGFQYTFTPSAGTSTSSATGGTAFTATNLNGGTGSATSRIYTLTVSDANNCIDTETVSITQPASITVNSSVTNIACNSASTGVITLSTSGGTPGTPAYSYTLSTGATTVGSIVSFTQLSVPSGTTSVVLTVTVSDGAGCTTTRTFTLTQPLPFTYAGTTNSVICKGACNGSIALSYTNGTGAISFNWPPVTGASFTGATTQSISGLCPGVFSVTVTDVNGCLAIGPNTFTITEPTNSLSITTSTLNPQVKCFGDCNATATFTVSGGTGAYTYSWSTNSSTTTSASSLCVGAHVVTVVDQNSCVTQSTISVAGPTVPIVTTFTVKPPSCPRAFNGTITTSITGTQGNVNYNWSPVGTGQNPTGLSAGGTGTLNYILIATDDSSCVHNATVTMIDPPAITSSVIVTASPTCFGDCDGAATASFSNAVGTPTVTWLSPLNTTSASIAGLCSNPYNGLPNIYSVSVVDQNGCTDTVSFALNNPTQLLVNSTVTPAQCGPNNGSITISGTGGTPAYTYTWIGSLSGNATTQASLAAGLYSVIISDANSCRDTIAIPVASINGPTATTSPTNITLQCNGVCSGSASISAISPTNTIFTWLAPIPSSVTSTSLTNLCAGNYTVELNDTVAKCKNYYSFVIAQPPALFTTSVMTEPTCFGLCDGALGVTISGGTPTYNLLWSGPNNFTAANVTNLTNVCGGVYTLNITDQNTCTNTIIYSVPVLNNIIVQQPIAVNNNSCFGNCNGSATVNVVSTTTNVLTANISWSNSQFGNVATGLCNGTYSVLVTDTRGCSNTFPVQITSPSSITLNSNVVQPACNRCDGSAVVTASGGNGPAYSYSWTTGDLTSSVTDLCAGLYQVVVTDNLNCSELHNVTINSSNGISGDTVLVQHEQCGLPCSGAATITAQGGASPITYNWITPSVPSTSNTGSNLCAGQYFVQMRDANNCIRTTPFTINPATTPTITAFVTPPSCGVTPANGSIQISAAGLTGPASYSWSPVTSSVSSVANLGTGIYTVVVTDLTTGCSSSKIIPLSNPTGPDFTVSQQNINCAGQTGSVGITVTSTSNVTYLWSTGATSSSVTNLQGGPITVTITDANGCEAMRSFTIDANTPMQSAAVTQGIRCQGNCDGIITVLPVGGTLPYTYTWSVQNSGTIRADSLCAGNYTIMVADAKGCRDTSIVDLVSPIAVTRTVNTVNSSCSTIPDGSASVIAFGGLPPYTYSWTGPNNFTSTQDSLKNILPGNYTVVVIDSLGCTSQSAGITVPPTVVLEANAGADILVCPITDAVLSGSNSIGAIGYTWIAVPSTTVSHTVDHATLAVETETFVLQVLSTVPGCFDRDTVVINVHPRPFLDAGPNSFTIPVRSTTVIGGAPTSLLGGPSHTWSPAEYLNDPMAQNPITNNTVNVTFTVSIEYGEGCIESDTVQVLVLPELRIVTGFSPNGDGKNDTWILDYIDQFPNNTVEVYNRWGDQVFFSKGYFEPFDGNYKGQKLPVGTYYYVIHLNHDSYTKPYTGPLTIFR